MRHVFRLSVVVLVVMTALSVAGWAVIRHSVDSQDQALLNTDAGQINLLFQTALQNAQTQLRSLAFFTESSGGSPQVFAQQAKPLLTSPATSVAVLDRSGGQVRVVEAAGRALHSDQPLPPPLVDAVLHAGVALTSGVVRVGGQSLLHLETVLSTDPTHVGLETSVVNPNRPAPNSSGPYSRVWVNVYNGSVANPAQLIVTTYGPRPLPRPVGVATTKFGAVTWLVEVSAKTAPSGGYAEASPWIALAVGLAVALALAGLVETLARRNRDAARLVEERTALYAEQRTVAETLQQALLPEVLPQLADAEVSVRYLPGVEGIHVGGDWYDLIALDDRHLLAVVGDVSGRGLRAASAMAALRYATRAYAVQGDAPTEILAKLSKTLSVETSGQFATVVLTLVDLDTRRITVVNGGHLPPLLLHDRQGEFIDGNVGLPVGVSPAASYNATTVAVPPGATFLAFTDGLVERRGESIDAGLGRLREAALADGRGTLDELLSHVVGTLVGSGSADDTVILGVRWRT
ncbi:MAG TPA: PP2C family protein-serine/threonine phosphatase [Acidimicrobiales bacterium]|nr:PP2C family protein-serine/threonine phosphatase [Acidimicrobiales bacterium]